MEYVGLILLVSPLTVGMVDAMKGFQVLAVRGATGGTHMTGRKAAQTFDERGDTWNGRGDPAA